MTKASSVDKDKVVAGSALATLGSGVAYAGYTGAGVAGAAAGATSAVASGLTTYANFLTAAQGWHPLGNLIATGWQAAASSATAAAGTTGTAAFLASAALPVGIGCAVCGGVVAVKGWKNGK